MSSGDWIQVIAIVVSLSVSLISILQTQKSMKLTENRIKEESRPYLSFYVDFKNKRNDQKLFAIENFGNTSAKILKITFDKKLDELNENFKFSSLINGTIAPKQKFTSVIHPDYKETVIVSLVYEDTENNLYKESFEVKTDIASALLYTREDTTEKVIRETNKAIAHEINGISKAINQRNKD